MKVFFSGVFDLFHAGHLLAIERAKRCGDYLVIGITSDEIVKKNKGENRPIIPQDDRWAVIKGLKVVDSVIIMKDFGAALDLIKPQVVVRNFPEYHSEERTECLKRGIKVVEFPEYVVNSGLNTSKIIEKINDSNRTV
jgi:cytidyltransferase-like protein